MVLFNGGFVTLGFLLPVSLELGWGLLVVAVVFTEDCLAFCLRANLFFCKKFGSFCYKRNNRRKDKRNTVNTTATPRV